MYDKDHQHLLNQLSSSIQKRLHAFDATEWAIFLGEDFDYLSNILDELVTLKNYESETDNLSVTSNIKKKLATRSN